MYNYEKIKIKIHISYMYPFSRVFYQNIVCAQLLIKNVFNTVKKIKFKRSKFFHSFSNRAKALIIVM